MNNQILVRLAIKLDRANQFLRAIEWGTPSGPIGYCPWCDGPVQVGHTSNCSLSKALKASSPIGDMGNLITEVKELQSMLRLGSVLTYMDGVHREIDDMEMLLGRIQSKIEDIW
jgi:hypothetical protein